ncbi:uncharacterized protein A4U43_C02F5950 [Asparagus officinalis]|uniref:XS domain-containing protein n=1 Tax=Asparagus officinalis TaxID=4686 RepID=A0A5P1FH02_ASPOF|nr:protein SUPPRESSOR OF GENE SILENCING 3 homolog [Asparagus officinalis]ONK77382.1 uncharacterized protein A4U43_C02F5950 [Asparagus officinalis]
MSARKGGGNSFFAGNAGGSSKGKGIDQLNHDMAKVSMDPTQEGEWEVKGKKSKNRGGAQKMSGGPAPAPNAWGANGGYGRASGNNWPQTGNVGAGRAAGNSWANAGNNSSPARGPGNWAQAVGRPAGRGYSKPQPAPRTWESTYMAPPPPNVPPPLHNGWNWGARTGASGSQVKDDESSNHPQDGYDSESDMARDEHDVVSDDDELLEDSDDDLSDEYDSDVSQKSHETRKNNKWFKGFFEALDKLTIEEISEPTRQWHCPACQKGPGAIDWYRGLQPLMTHAKTKGAKRAQLHRELAKLLDEELRRKGTSIIPSGEAFGKWRGLRETTTDHEIVWPPMVVVMNTLLEIDDNEKWIGMGNQELLEYFSTYAAKKARHSYGPNGHRGMSILMFEPTAMGYLEAERLHKHFSEQGTDKDAWERRRVLFYPGGKRQLYGYLASKEDMEVFNHHCHGKSRLKYELKSYLEMVVNPMKQMSEDNQQLTYLKHKVVKEERRSKVLEETVDVVSQKLRETVEENRIVRQRTKMQHEENKEQMDFLEQFSKEQLAKVQKDIEEKERQFEVLLQEERAKAKLSDVNSGSSEERELRKEKIQRFIDSQVKGVEEFEIEREKLMLEHEEKKVELKRRYLGEEVELEKEFDTALTKLMSKYAPSSFETSTRS